MVRRSRSRSRDRSLVLVLVLVLVLHNLGLGNKVDEVVAVVVVRRSRNRRGEEDSRIGPVAVGSSSVDAEDTGVDRGRGSLAAEGARTLLGNC